MLRRTKRREAHECRRRARASSRDWLPFLANMAGPLAVAVSGGVDSLTLATFVHRAAGSRVEMFHAVSPAVPGDATARVELLAAAQGWRLRMVDAGEFTDETYLANPVDRCFFCKTNLYGCNRAPQRRADSFGRKSR